MECLFVPFFNIFFLKKKKNWKLYMVELFNIFKKKKDKIDKNSILKKIVS